MIREKSLNNFKVITFIEILFYELAMIILIIVTCTCLKKVLPDITVYIIYKTFIYM